MWWTSRVARTDSTAASDLLHMDSLLRRSIGAANDPNWSTGQTSSNASQLPPYQFLSGGSTAATWYRMVVKRVRNVGHTAGPVSLFSTETLNWDQWTLDDFQSKLPCPQLPNSRIALSTYSPPSQNGIPAADSGPLFPSAAQRSRNHSVRATFLHIFPTPLKRERQSENSSSDPYVPPNSALSFFKQKPYFFSLDDSSNFWPFPAVSMRRDGRRWITNCRVCSALIKIFFPPSLKLTIQTESFFGSGFDQ